MNKKYYMPFNILTFTYSSKKLYQKDDDYIVKYSNVKWELKSMKKYDSYDVYINTQCLYKIYDGKTFITEGFLMDNIDFAKKINAEYKLY